MKKEKLKLWIYSNLEFAFIFLIFSFLRLKDLSFLRTYSSNRAANVAKRPEENIFSDSSAQKISKQTF